jgi:hypothetical protein
VVLLLNLTFVCFSSLFLQRGPCPDNDVCDKATTIDALPFVDFGSNLLATAEAALPTTCNIVDGSARTLWYEFIGDGSCVSASVVGEDFEAVLALYEGESCEAISCAAQTEYDDRGRLSWRSVNGVTYRILVAGAYGSQAGDFLLVVAVRSFHSEKKCFLFAVVAICLVAQHSSLAFLLSILAVRGGRLPRAARE